MSADVRLDHRFCITIDEGCLQTSEAPRIEDLADQHARLASDLVTVFGFPASSRQHSIVVDFVLGGLHSHRFLSFNPKETKRSLSGISEKLLENSKPRAAARLNELVDSYYSKRQQKNHDTETVIDMDDCDRI